MNQILHYTLLLSNSTIEVGSLLLDLIFVFLSIENTFQIEASTVSNGGFALLSKQDVVMHFGFHTPCTQNSGVVSPKHTNSFKVSQSARLKKPSSKAAK